MTDRTYQPPTITPMSDAEATALIQLGELKSAMLTAWSRWREEHPHLDVRSDEAIGAVVQMAYSLVDADVLEVLRPLVATMFWLSEADGTDAVYGDTPRGVLRNVVAEMLLTEVRS